MKQGLPDIFLPIKNKDDLGRISSGFMMFGGGKLEWEEEKYLQEAKNLFLRRRIFLFFILGWGAFLLFCWQIKKTFRGCYKKIGGRE